MWIPSGGWPTHIVSYWVRWRGWRPSWLPIVIIFFATADWAIIWLLIYVASMLILTAPPWIRPTSAVSVISGIIVSTIVIVGPIFVVVIIAVVVVCGMLWLSSYNSKAAHNIACWCCVSRWSISYAVSHVGLCWFIIAPTTSYSLGTWWTSYSTRYDSKIGLFTSPIWFARSWRCWQFVSMDEHEDNCKLENTNCSAAALVFLLFMKIGLWSRWHRILLPWSEEHVRKACQIRYCRSIVRQGHRATMSNNRRYIILCVFSGWRCPYQCVQRLWRLWLGVERV